MRKVVTGSQVAQLRNPDPFAVPAWRSPVYRTPGWIVIVAQLARVLWRLARFARRHPLAVAVTLPRTGSSTRAWYSSASPEIVMTLGQRRR